MGGLLLGPLAGLPAPEGCRACSGLLLATRRVAGQAQAEAALVCQVGGGPGGPDPDQEETGTPGLRAEGHQAGGQPQVGTSRLPPQGLVLDLLCVAVWASPRQGGVHIPSVPSCGWQGASDTLWIFCGKKRLELGSPTILFPTGPSLPGPSSHHVGGGGAGGRRLQEHQHLAPSLCLLR